MPYYLIHKLRLPIFGPPFTSKPGFARLFRLPPKRRGYSLRH